MIGRNACRELAPIIQKTSLDSFRTDCCHNGQHVVIRCAAGRAVGGRRRDGRLSSTAGRLSPAEIRCIMSSADAAAVFCCRSRVTVGVTRGSAGRPTTQARWAPAAAAAAAAAPGRRPPLASLRLAGQLPASPPLTGTNRTDRRVSVSERGS